MSITSNAPNPYESPKYTTWQKTQKGIKPIEFFAVVVSSGDPTAFQLITSAAAQSFLFPSMDVCRLEMKGLIEAGHKVVGIMSVSRGRFPVIVEFANGVGEKDLTLPSNDEPSQDNASVGSW